MAFTTIKSTNIAEGAITTAKIAATVSLGVKISNVAIANSSYTVLDDTAVALDGGYIVITGSGFASGAQVMIDQTPATSVTVVDSSTIRAQVPSANAATYNLYVVNSDGSTGIRVNGLTYSGTPTWVTGTTLDNQAVDVAFSVALDATGAVSYANSTALPAGTALLSNGYFYGTVTGISEETVYNFTVNAVDAENQDSPRTFSVTVTVGPPPSYLYAFGRNTFGQLGHNDIIDKSSPTQVGSDTTWYNISISRTGPTMSTKLDGTLWLWGNNNYGQLGLGDTINRSSPTQVGSGTTWNLISAGLYCSMAIKTDGTLWSWGNNLFGKLGHNEQDNKNSPIQVGSSTDWSKVASSFYNTIAIKTDGTLWLWGRNNYGQLGQNDTIHKSSPTQVGSDTTWNNIAINYYSVAAIKSDGTLWSWGDGGYGQLGHNDTIRKSSPTQVGSLTTWNNISRGHQSTIATKTDGTLWLWGYNEYGSALGLNDTIHRSSPTQVGSDTTWYNISMGVHSTMATKTNGTLWTWGNNVVGQLGLGDKSSRSSPTQVGTDTTWNLVSIGQYNSIATKKV